MKIATIVLLGLLPGMAMGRLWTGVDGRTLEAEYVRLEGDSVVLMLRGKETKVELTRFIAVDQDFAKGQQPKSDGLPGKKDTPGALPHTAEFEAAVPLQTGPPPEVAIETVKEDAAASEFIYASNHFEFRCNRRLTARVIAGFAKLYEATYEAVKAMPWDAQLNPRNDSGKFVVRLFTDEDDFIKAGGIKGSAGTAAGAVSLAQLKYLGVKDTGVRLILEDIKDNTMLVHELTHALRDEADRGLPTWAIEGFAEYVAAAPYERTGKFSFDHRLEDAVKYSAYKSGASGEFKMPMRLEEMLNASRSQFYKDEGGGLGKGAGINYAMSTLVITYFWHADKGKDNAKETGAPIRAWLKAIKDKKPEKEARALLLDGRSYEEIEKSIMATYRRNIQLKF